MLLLKRFATGLMWLISLLPLPVLHLISIPLSLLLFHVVKYRRKVVFTNLRNAFPTKTNSEIRKIAKKYYLNLSDLIVEIIKIRHMSAKQMDRRITFSNLELLEKLYDSGRNLFVITGHIGNWEWFGMLLSLKTKYKTIGVFKPLSDPYFNEYLLKLRNRYGRGELIPFKSILRVLVKNKNRRNLALIAGDQTPLKSGNEYWTTFLNQETAVFPGPEKMAVSLDYSVVFLSCVRVKRGYYHINFDLIAEKPGETKEWYITEQHVKRLEDFIHAHPDNWLWSHRRWKFKKTAE